VTTLLLLVYGAGVLLGLARTDAPWWNRVGFALLWPLGPLAFLATVAGLLLVALVAWTGAGKAARHT
jgi:hypothetical protein